MRLRLPRWLRREPAPQGRHVRRPAPVTAPSAAAALVMGAAEPYLVAPTPVEPPVTEPPVERAALTASAEAPVADLPVPHLPPPGPDPITDGDEATLPVTSGDLAPAHEPVDEPAAPGLAATPPSLAVALPGTVSTEDGAPEPPAPAEATVALGFADGGVLELAPDDPRLAGFQDAAAAVLARPEA
mgnify:CR=1 FL=1